jgi:hypothetical protein
VSTPDRLRHELQSLLDRALRRGVDERGVAQSAGLAVFVSVGRDESDRRRDLVVSAHAADARSFSGLALQLTDSRGSTLRGRVDERGQVVLRGVGPEPWVTRVVREPLDERVPQLEINRRLPLAAAFGSSELEYTATDTGGRVAVTLHEDEEQHLHAEFRGELPDASLARLSWVSRGRHDDEVVRAVVTPLVPSLGGSAAAYDLGPLADASAIAVYPVEIVEIDEIELDDLEATVATIWRGSARRAWSGWLSRYELAPDLRAVLDRAVR